MHHHARLRALNSGCQSRGCSPAGLGQATKATLSWCLQPSEHLQCASVHARGHTLQGHLVLPGIEQQIHALAEHRLQADARHGVVIKAQELAVWLQDIGRVVA